MDDAGRHCLLTGRQVAIAADASGFVLPLGFGLENPVQHHLRIEALPDRWRESRPDICVAVEMDRLCCHRKASVPQVDRQRNGSRHASLWALLVRGEPRATQEDDMERTRPEEKTCRASPSMA